MSAAIRIQPEDEPGDLGALLCRAMKVTGVPKRRAYKVAEVAFLLGGIDERQVYELIRGGQLRHFQVGRHYLVPDTEVDRYVDEHSKTA